MPRLPSLSAPTQALPGEPQRLEAPVTRLHRQDRLTMVGPDLIPVTAGAIHGLALDRRARVGGP